jgi:hypothetical protein
MSAVLSGIPLDSVATTLARGAANGIADLAVRSLGGGQPVEVPLDAPPPVDPLLDLRLPEAMRAWLKPAADALGLTLEDGVARDKYGRRERRVTYLTNGDVRRALLHIDPDVLNDRNAYEPLGMVMWAMEENEFVAVFGTNVKAPLPVNANVIEDLWKRRPMNSRFISWSFVEELPTLDLLDQVEFLRGRLGLEAFQPRTYSASAGAGEVTAKDIGRIVSILSALNDFNDVRGRKALLMQAGLIAIAGVVNLEGAPKSVGLDLVWQTTQHPDRVPPDNHTALGALLRTVVTYPDMPPSDANWLKALITRCAL